MATNDVIIRIKAHTKAFDAKMRRMDKALEKMGDRAKIVAKASATALAAIGVPIGIAISRASKFELGMTNVQKVADLSAFGLKKFENNIKSLSKEIPATTEELLETSAAAAVLGIRGADNLTKFSKTMAMLGVTTDVQGGEAAKAIARIISLSGEADETIDKFGSSLVALGNNFKASESEILENTIRIRQATSAFKLSSAEVLAFGAATREAGLQAEIVGTGLGRTFRALQRAIGKGGKALTALQEITGKTREELKETFQRSPAEMFRVFINGLSKTNRSATTTTDLLGAMGIKGERMMAVLPSLAKLSHRLGAALDLSNKEYTKNNALVNEANKFYESASQQFKLFRNKVDALAISVGQKLLPVWTRFLRGFGDFLSSLDDPKGVARIIWWGKVLAGLSATVLALSGTIWGVSAAIKGYVAVSTAAQAIMGAWPAISAAYAAAMRVMTIATRVYIGATGVGLILVALGIIYERWDQIWGAMKNTYNWFADSIVSISKRISNALMEAYNNQKKLRDLQEDYRAGGHRRRAADREMPETGSGVLRKEDDGAEELDKTLGYRGDTPLLTGGEGEVDEEGKALSVEEEIEKRKERAQLLGEALEVQQAIAREKTILKKKEFNNMLLNIDQEKHAKELAILKKHLKSGTVEEKKNAETRLKQLSDSGKKEMKLSHLVQNEKMNLAKQSGQLINAMLGENNKIALAMNKALAVADVIIKFTQAEALATSTGNLALIPWLKAQKYVSLATIAAQTFMTPKKAQTGALVRREVGTPATGDNQIYKLSAGELVSPRDRAQSVIEKEAAQHASKYKDDVAEESETNKQIEVVVGIEEDAADFINAMTRQNAAIGVGVY